MRRSIAGFDPAIQSISVLAGSITGGPQIVFALGLAD